MDRVCVFLGSSPGCRPAYRDAARSLGRELAQRGVGLVFGGSDRGMMGALADELLAAGREVIGVIPGPMVRNGWSHDRLPDLRVVDTMHERKALMYSLADAIIALPGGIGTLDELIEVLAWTQLGIQAKPIGLLDTEGYFDPLLAMFSRAEEEGFLDRSFREFFVVARDAATLLDALERATPSPNTHSWTDE